MADASHALVEVDDVYHPIFVVGILHPSEELVEVPVEDVVLPAAKSGAFANVGDGELNDEVVTLMYLLREGGGRNRQVGRRNGRKDMDGSGDKVVRAVQLEARIAGVDHEDEVSVVGLSVLALFKGDARVVIIAGRTDLSVGYIGPSEELIVV